MVELNRLADGDGTLAMVGDGVNDAVLMRDDLKALPFAVWLSRRARRRVRQNMGFAFAVIVFLLMATFLGLPLWLGVIGHEGSTLLVVLNGLRLLWERPPEGVS